MARNRDRLSPGALQDGLRELLRSLSGGPDRPYLFAMSYDGVVQLFPPFPEREGQNELDRLDGEGRAVNREMPAPAGGREAFADARAVRPDVPALFASGYNENALHTNFVLDAGLRLIRKPFTRPELLGRVREALDEARKNGPGAGGGA